MSGVAPSNGRASLGERLSDVRSKVAAGLVVVLGAALAGIALAPPTAPDANTDRPVYHFVLRDSTERLWPVVAADGSVWIAAPTGAPPHRRFLVRRPGATARSEVSTTEVAGAAFLAVSLDGRRAAYARDAGALTVSRLARLISQLASDAAFALSAQALAPRIHRDGGAQAVKIIEEMMAGAA